MISRRTFVALPAVLAAADTPSVIDIHQHTNYSGRTDDQLIAHQRKMGIAKTILLPAGSKYGLAASAGGNETVLRLAREYPKEFVFFANELPDLPETRSVLEKYLKAGAIGIGEQKFPVECDSKPMDLIASIAAEHDVPVLMHFQHEAYNFNIKNFPRLLARHPRVRFIGHAQTWWGNIDSNHDQAVMYPKTRVTRGGLTDRLLSDYENVYGDLSAGSGLNALVRDEDHARGFLERHKNKLLYGSDCNDREGAGEACSGSKCLQALKRLTNVDIFSRISSGNSQRLFRLTL
jgi:predicted TIM-barrel fold metal-dependent hydrolase